MSFKLRFALRFTSSVAVILLVCFLSIYLLYSGYRKETYFDRIHTELKKAEALYLVAEADSLASIDKIFDSMSYRPALAEERVYITDTIGRLLFHTASSEQIPVGKERVQSLRAPGMVIRFENGDRQYVASRLGQQGIMIWVSAYDRIGLQKLRSLLWILLIVFLAALLLTAFISFFFSSQVSRPLLRLGKQMSDITLLDLRKRVPEDSSFREVNLIASSFNAMLVKVEKAFEFQKSFVHHASHELRTPLATMLAHTEAALNNQLTIEEYRIVLGSLKQDQERMIELTNSLLLISQFEQQGFDSQWPELRIDELIYDKISNSMKMFPDLSVSLVFEHTPVSDDDLLVIGNEALLKSMFSNLIRNAYHYSTNKKVELLLETGSEYTMVHVNNKGEHLPPEEQEKIMIPFFRGQAARQRSSGVGLGLTIVQRILDIHKGKLIYTAHGKNVNRFTVILPTAKRLREQGEV
jgi:signal transduction histidine kinase